MYDVVDRQGFETERIELLKQIEQLKQEKEALLVENNSLRKMLKQCALNNL